MKNPDYPDTLYVTELVAPNTVNTMPEKTLDALADHGEITGAQCSVGLGLGRACDDLSITGHTLTVEATALRPHTPVTVRAGVDDERPIGQWAGALEAELLKFPTAKHDDYVAAMAMIGLGLDSQAKAAPGRKPQAAPQQFPTGTIQWIREQTRRRERETKLQEAMAHD